MILLQHFNKKTAAMKTKSKTQSLQQEYSHMKLLRLLITKRKTTSKSKHSDRENPIRARIWRYHSTLTQSKNKTKQNPKNPNLENLTTKSWRIPLE